MREALGKTVKMTSGGGGGGGKGEKGLLNRQFLILTTSLFRTAIIGTILPRDQIEIE